MASIGTGQPLFDDRSVRSINFFNGRLLTGEDMTKEQAANAQAREQLGAALGKGVVTGLEVTRPPLTTGQNSSSSLLPRVTVGRGMAINAHGQVLQLYDDIDVLLVGAPSTDTQVKQGGFSSAQGTPANTVVTDGDVSLLTVALAEGKQGFATVSGFSASGGSTATAACTTSYNVDAIQFHLISLKDSGLLTDADRMRNRLAYACFGFTDLVPPPTPVSPDLLREYLFDRLRLKLDDDVPLAIISWSSSGEIEFIDTWAVRRCLVHPAFTGSWNGVIGDLRLAEAEAMLLQFQSHLVDMQQGVATARRQASASQVPASTNTLKELKAEQYFSYLPAAGYLPLGQDGFDWQTFLGSLAPPSITCVDRGLLRLILYNSFYEEPIKVGSYIGKQDPSNEKPLDVYQDASLSSPGYVLFARSSTGRVQVTVNATGYQPADLQLTLAPGQQSSFTVPLKPSGGAGEQLSPSIDVELISRPALHQVRLSMVQIANPVTFPPAAAGPAQKFIKVDPLEKDLTQWLSGWQTRLNALYPNHGIDCATPAIYIDDYYTPPKINAGKEDIDVPAPDAAGYVVFNNIPAVPWAYAVFGTFAVPLLINLSYYTTPLPVPLARSGIAGLTDDVVRALAGTGLLYVDQVAGAWSGLIEGVTSIDGKYLINDALNAVERLDATLGYYEGIDRDVTEDRDVKETLEQMAIADDVALANADQQELGEQLKSRGFANRLVMQARRAVPPADWQLEQLGFKAEQIQALQSYGIDSKGAFAHRAETDEGRAQLLKVPGLNEQAIKDLHTKAFAQLTASSYARAHVKNLLLMPNVNAQVATNLAAQNIITTDDAHRADKAKLIQAGLSEDAAEELKKEAKEAGKEGLEVVKLASVSRGVAEALRAVGIDKIAHLFEKGGEAVQGAFEKLHAERAGNFVSALFDGIQGTGR